MAMMMTEWFAYRTNVMSYDGFYALCYASASD